MSVPTLTFACGLYDRMVPLYIGDVRSDAFNLRFEAIDEPRVLFDRLVREKEFDAARILRLGICLAFLHRRSRIRRDPGVCRPSGDQVAQSRVARSMDSRDLLIGGLKRLQAMRVLPN
jgi:hypothetical protein